MKELVPEISYTAIETEAQRIENTPRVATAVQDMRIVSMSGIIAAPERYWSLDHSERLPKETSVADVIDSMGEWTALAAAELDGTRQYLLFADPSGFAPIFYSLIPGEGIVFSDTFSGAAQGVRRLGGHLSVNVENYVTLISNQGTYFQNIVTPETMSNEIRILPYDKALFVDYDRVSLINRADLTKANQVTDYNEALDAGIDFATDTIETIMNANVDATYAITLTGGADSRMVFALLSLTGKESEFGLWTIDPRDRKSPYQKKVFTADVEIANELRQRYNLKWVSPFVKEKISISYEESLGIHQNHNSNFAFTFGPASSLSYNLTPAVTLRGGGGEILRGTGGARIMHSRFIQYRDAGGEKAEVPWLSTEYLEKSVLTAEARSIADGFLTRAFKANTRETFQESFDVHYRSTRNRAHFGHIRRAASVNDRLLQVLSNPYLVRAADLLSYQERVRGDLVRELLDRIDPQLRDVPFENPETDKLLRRSPSHKFKFRERDSWIAALDKRGRPSRSVGYRRTMEPGARLEKRDFSVAERNSNFIMSGFEEVLDSVGHSEREILYSQHREVLKRIDMRSRGASILSAKVASATDVLAPMPLDRPGRHLFTCLSAPGKIQRSDILRAKAGSYYRT